MYMYMWMYLYGSCMVGKVLCQLFRSFAATLQLGTKYKHMSTTRIVPLSRTKQETGCILGGFMMRSLGLITSGIARIGEERG